MPKRKRCGKGRYPRIHFTANVFCFTLLIFSAPASWAIESERELQGRIQQAMQTGPSAAFAQSTSQPADSRKGQGSSLPVGHEGQEAYLVKDELRGWDNMIRQEQFEDRLLEEDRKQDDFSDQALELQSENQFSKSLDEHDSFEDQIQQSVVFDSEEKQNLTS